MDKDQMTRIKESKIEFYTLKIRIIWLKDLLNEATEYIFEKAKNGGIAKNLYERMGRALADKTISKTVMKDLVEWKIDKSMDQAINCNNCKHKGVDKEKVSLRCETCIRFNDRLKDNWETKLF